MGEKIKQRFETPQEIQLWIVLPLIKRELAMILAKKHKKKQKEIAALLQMTPAAISQYLHGKRAASGKLTKAMKARVEESAEAILNGAYAMKEIIKLLNDPLFKDYLCQLHKSIDPAFTNCSWKTVC